MGKPLLTAVRVCARECSQQSRKDAKKPRSQPNTLCDPWRLCAAAVNTPTHDNQFKLNSDENG